MRNLYLLSIVAMAALVVGCTGNRDAVESSGSQLSDVTIATPVKSDLEQAYGSGCERVKLSQQVLQQVQPAVGCDAVLALTKKFRLTVEGGACADGTRGTSIAATTGQLGNQAISTNLKRNCDYSVKLELGLGDTYYFDNVKTWRKNLPRSKITGETAELTVRLSATAAGQGAGIPPTAEVRPTGFTKLKVRVNFGRPVTSESDSEGAPGGNAQPSSTSPAGPVTFAMPANWNGHSFEGDAIFGLQRLN